MSALSLCNNFVISIIVCGYPSEGECSSPRPTQCAKRGLILRHCCLTKRERKRYMRRKHRAVETTTASRGATARCGAGKARGEIARRSDARHCKLHSGAVSPGMSQQGRTQVVAVVLALSYIAGRRPNKRSWLIHRRPSELAALNSIASRPRSHRRDSIVTCPRPRRPSSRPPRGDGPSPGRAARMVVSSPTVGKGLCATQGSCSSR